MERAFQWFFKVFVLLLVLGTILAFMVKLQDVLVFKAQTTGSLFWLWTTISYTLSMIPSIIFLISFANSVGNLVSGSESLTFEEVTFTTVLGRFVKFFSFFVFLFLFCMITMILFDYHQNIFKEIKKSVFSFGNVFSIMSCSFALIILPIVGFVLSLYFSNFLHEKIDPNHESFFSLILGGDTGLYSTGGYSKGEKYRITTEDEKTGKMKDFSVWVKKE